MEDRALADRLTGYADALVAVAFVGMSGLSLGLGDPDVRCSLVRVGGYIIGWNVIAAVVVLACVAVLRHWENDLRRDAPPSAKAARYSGRLHWVRVALVLLSMGLTVATLTAAMSDSNCARQAGSTHRSPALSVDDAPAARAA